MKTAALALLLALGGVGCGDDDDDAGEGEGEGCAVPDEACPPEPPLPGGLCTGDLECPYPGDAAWTFFCRGERWTFDVECDVDCPVPPLAELCLAPFEGDLPMEIVLGPDDPTEPMRAFEPGERVPLVLGPQGGSMVAFRIEVGDTQAPDCVGATIVVTADGVTGEPQEARVALHCGLSQPVWAILPESYCDAGDYPVTLDVELAGIGGAEVAVEFHSAGICVR